MKIRTYISLILLFSATLSLADTYYVDSRYGHDDLSGKSIQSAWKTLAKVNQFDFDPGDSVCFRRGSSWSGELHINHSGTENKFITYTAYDTGQEPVITNPGVQNGSAIRINADWIIVEHFLIREVHEAGIFIERGADHNIVRYNEVTRAGTGVAIRGQYNLATVNYLHDLTIIVSSPGGDDDYGAVGVSLLSSNNEISYNRMINCKAPSLDYGQDGGVVEFYGDVDSCYIHHNWGENCDGSFEVGGRNQTLSHNIISYNIFLNNGIYGGFHVGGKFGINIEDMRIENNTFIDTGNGDYAIGFWNGKPSSVDIKYRNNIFYIPDFKRISNYMEFIHQHNIYYLKNGNYSGFTSKKDEINGDPLFINLKSNDFHLRANSPAVDLGMDLGYESDFDGKSVPFGKAPDAGAFEYSHASKNN